VARSVWLWIAVFRFAQYYIFHCISGRRVFGLSDEGYRFALAEPCIRGLEYHHRSGGNIGNASVSYHLSSREFRSQISIVSKLSPGNTPPRPSSHHNTVCGIRSPQRIARDFIFLVLHCFYLSGAVKVLLLLIVRPRLLPLPSSQGTRRAGTSGKTSHISKSKLMITFGSSMNCVASRSIMLGYHTSFRDLINQLM